MTGGVDGGKMNANATSTGVSAGNSVGPAEAVRIDFVVDLTGTPGNNDYAPLANQTHAFDSHYSANGASAFFSNIRSEEHTSELQSLMRISYAVFCLKKNKKHESN